MNLRDACFRWMMKNEDRETLRSNMERDFRIKIEAAICDQPS